MSDIVNGHKVISIEEYRAYNFTDEEEWNQMYNPKRHSIETIDNILTRKKGKGELKKTYTNISDLNSSNGPYYDPTGIHLHVWKSYKLIPNLIGPQKQNSPYIQFTELKPGTYCCICHEINKCSHRFTWKKNIEPEIIEKNDTPSVVPVPLSKDEYITFDNLPDEPLKVENKISKWPRIMYKVLYMLNNKKILYPISNYKSLLLWPWEMTYYQKFKLNNPNYKKSNIFLENDLDKFREDYAYII